MKNKKKVYFLVIFGYICKPKNIFDMKIITIKPSAKDFFYDNYRITMKVDVDETAKSLNVDPSEIKAWINDIKNSVTVPENLSFAEKKDWFFKNYQPEKKMNIKEISKDIGVSRTAVYKWIKKIEKNTILFS